MAARPRRTERCKALRLVCWNADGVHGRKLELEHFLSQQGVDISLLSETFLKPGQAFRLANYVCHHTDRPTAPDPLGGYCHPSYIGWQTGEDPCGLPLSFPPTDRSGPDRLFRRGIAGPDGRRPQRQTRGLEFAAEHETGKLLRDYADENSCLIFGPDTPTTNPYNSSATPDVLDFAIVKDLPFPVYLTSCPALSSDHLPVLIGTACRSSFQHPPDRSDFRRTDWANFQSHLEDQIPFDPELHNGMAIDTCDENFSGSVLKALAASTTKCRPRDDPRPPIPAGIQDEIRLKNRLRRQWQFTRDPALKAEVNRLQRSVTRRLNEWRNDQ